MLVKSPGPEESRTIVIYVPDTIVVNMCKHQAKEMELKIDSMYEVIADDLRGLVNLVEWLIGETTGRYALAFHPRQYRADGCIYTVIAFEKVVDAVSLRLMGWNMKKIDEDYYA